MMVSPFERFVKAFGHMAKHMGVFATNFKIMDPVAIDTFREWTDSMVQISKVDISKSNGIIDFINDIVSAGHGNGTDPTVPGDKPPQEYTEEEKRRQLQSGGGNRGGGGDRGGNQGGGQVNTAAIANAIKSALTNLEIKNVTVTGKFDPYAGGR